MLRCASFSNGKFPRKRKKKKTKLFLVLSLNDSVVMKDGKNCTVDGNVKFHQLIIIIIDYFHYFFSFKIGSLFCFNVFEWTIWWYIMAF